MNLKYIVLSVFISSVYWGKTQAQTLDEAVTFSKEDLAGSARIKGMGNVQTALGGDISSISGNPAGLGFYTRSDVSATFNLSGNKYKTNYFNSNSTSDKTNFGIDQVGAVFYMPKNSYSGWQNLNIGINYNKTQNFNGNLAYEGVNPNSTIVNTLTDLMYSNSTFKNDFIGSKIVDEFADANNGFFPIANEIGNKTQYNEIITRGNKGKTSISFGANYNNTIYIGGSVGFTTFNYEKSSMFIENGETKKPSQIIIDNPNSTFADPSNANYKYTNTGYELFDNFNQRTTGTGVDLKIGAIFKPTSDWNIGVTVATPTWMNVVDETRAYTDIDYYNLNESYGSKYYDSSTEYNMTTPWKFGLGITKFFGRGLVSADVDYVAYNSIRYSTPDGSGNFGYNTLNKNVSNNLQGVANVRVGAEYLFTNIISGRAGFNYFGNPYKNFDDTKNYSGSLGLGVKLSNTMYLDLAVVHQVSDYSVSPYILSDLWLNAGLTDPIANISNRRTSGILTIGARF